MPTLTIEVALTDEPIAPEAKLRFALKMIAWDLSDAINNVSSFVRTTQRDIEARKNGTGR